MNGAGISGFTPLILQTDFNVSRKALGIIEVPQIIASGQKAVEQDKPYRGIGGALVCPELDLVKCKFCLDAAVVQDIVFYVAGECMVDRTLH